MTDPLSDPIEIEYRVTDAVWSGVPRDHDRLLNGRRIHTSRDAALAAVAQDARAKGAPEDARVLLDYDPINMVDRVIVDWYVPGHLGQPRLLRQGRFESFRLSEVPR